MKPEDPDFPEGIPPIPESGEDESDSLRKEITAAQGEEPTTADESADMVQAENRGTDALDHEVSANATQSPGNDRNGGITFEESSDTRDGKDIDYDQSLGAPAAEPANPEPTISQSSSRSKTGNGRQREAEKPVAFASNDPFDDWGQTKVPYQSKELGIIDQLLLLLADGATAWRKVLRWVRSQLPSTWQRRLSDAVMTAIALGLLVLFLSLWNPLGREQATTAAEQSAPPQSLAESPQNSPERSSMEDKTLDPAPATGLAPLPEAAPEQSLIADIQDQVSNISRTYAAGLIQSVEVNLPENRLIIHLGENWYGLLNEQQNQVSQSIFEQVRQLDFKTLQFRDPDGVVVARNPVVGNNMVILHRSRSNDTELLVS